KLSTFGALRRPLLKRKAKTLFLRLTTETKHRKGDSETHKRRESAKALVEIIRSQPDGEDIVARRFVKTAERQQAGLQALLRLSDDEQDQAETVLSNMTETDSSCLLTMLLEHSKGRTLFQDTLPNILENATFGIAGVRFLAELDMQGVMLLDPRLVANFVRRVMQNTNVGSFNWNDGVALLDFLLRPMRQVPQTSPLASHLARVVFEEVTKAFDPQNKSSTTSSTTQNSHVVEAAALRAIYSSCVFVMRENGDPSEWIPLYLPHSLYPRIPIGSVAGDLARVVATCLAIISTMLSFPSILTRVGEHASNEVVDQFVDTCTQVMLGSTGWQSHGRDRIDVEGFPRLRPDEDAFDILRRLPGSTFGNALRRVINGVREKSKSDKLTGVSRLLGSLIWLSLRSSQFPEAHNALTDSGACEFLFEVMRWTVPPESDYQYRDICRAKGEALTCLGNICEFMEAKELEAMVSKEMMDCVLSIRDSKSMPTVQYNIFFGKYTFLVLMRNSEAGLQGPSTRAEK
ncbi:hypothetical protein FS837_000577, partial [Tulasnella sp. UAMH 9824]